MFKNKLGKSFSNPFYEIFQDSLHEINLIEQTISQIEKNLTASEQDFIEKYNEKNVKLNDPHLADPKEFSEAFQAKNDLSNHQVYFYNYYRYSFIIMIYASLESFLHRIFYKCSKLHTEDIESEFKLEASLEDYKKMIKKLGIALNPPNHSNDWKQLTELQLLRNLIVHQNGRIDDLKRIKGDSNYRKVQQIIREKNKSFLDYENRLYICNNEPLNSFISAQKRIIHLYSKEISIKYKYENTFH